MIQLFKCHRLMPVVLLTGGMLFSAMSFAAGGELDGSQGGKVNNAQAEIAEIIKRAREKRAGGGSPQPAQPASFGGNSNDSAAVAVARAELARITKKQTAPVQQGPVSSGGDSGPGGAPMIDAGLSTQAYSNMVQGLLPLSPKQIRNLHKLYDNTDRAISTSPSTPPRPTSSSVIVNLSPGSTPPVIRLQSGFITSVVFLDSTGSPWPIKAYDIGDPNRYNVQWNGKGNTLLVQALSSYKPANMAVILKGLNTPVMLTLVPGQQAVDYRVDLRVPGMGPNASLVSYGGTGAASANTVLLDVLNGVPPSGAKVLSIVGGEGQAWTLAGQLYLRTHMTLLSPGWLEKMESVDHTKAYVLGKTPVILVSDHGAVRQLELKLKG